MNLKTILTKLALVVADEAVSNPDFAKRVEEVLSSAAPRPATTRAARSSKAGAGKANPSKSDAGKTTEVRRGGRRAPAQVDPVAIAPSGEFAVRDALRPLELDRLLDVVAEYGMDPGKQVMKWKDRDRVIDRIVELSLSRATKGDAFREG